MRKNPLRKKPGDNFPLEELEKIIKPSDKLCLWSKPVDRKDITVARFELSDRPKPSGVWYGCGLSWIDWISSEMPNWLYNHLYRITFDTRSMYKISTDKDLDKFTQKYDVRGTGRSIHWAYVGAAGYGGIEICPYIASRRYSKGASWYGGWDVASGCIWDTSIITSVTEVILDG